MQAQLSPDEIKPDSRIIPSTLTRNSVDKLYGPSETVLTGVLSSYKLFDLQLF